MTVETATTKSLNQPVSYHFSVARLLRAHFSAALAAMLMAVLVTMSMTLSAVSFAESEGAGNKDPLEGMNRIIFSFNDTADRFVLKPIALGYHYVTPDPVENGIGRMFDNVGEIVNVVNDVLQGKFGQAGNDTGRLLVNSTIGLAGFFDVADSFGLEKNEGEDFGQTMGRWGVGDGAYLVLPFLGPSNLRDAPGRLVDSFLNPISDIDHVPTRNQIYGAGVLSTRAQLLEAEKLISGDKYSFMRDAYTQRREYLVNDGEVEDDFGGDDDYY
ncbi:MAG: VacJ family lipoprotein [Porticoccaceae bacterium]